jgi:phosphatidylinositol alpha 1,6-mannosyltransferase
MRIAIVTESFLPNINGVTNSVLRLLEFCDAYGHEAIVIAPESGKPISEYMGFQVKRTPSLNFKRLIPIGFPNFSIRHYLEGFQPDVIHLASPTFLGSYLNNVAQQLKIPTISIYQTDLGGFARHYGLSIGSELLQNRLARIHSNTNRTLVPSTWAKEELEKRGTRNVHVLPRGVDLIRFHPNKRDASLRNSWSDDGRKKIVGYMGRVANEKSIDDLSIFNSDKDIQVVIVGDGPAMKKIRRAIPHAIYTGMKTGDELAIHLASLDIFVHTGRHETFCQSIQEALASGVPAVAPASGGPVDLIQPLRNGALFEPGNRQSLKATIYGLLESDLGEYEFSARESVLGRSWDQINRRLYEHYLDVIELEKNMSLRKEVA